MLLFCLVAPSLIGLKLLDSLLKNMKVKDLILNYGVINVITNFITVILFTYIFHFSNDMGLEANVNSYNVVAIKFLVIATFICLVVSFIYSLFLKNISISLEINEKE